MLTYDTLPQEIINAFRKNITTSVAFVKKDGSVRHMAFRRNLKAYIASDREKTEKQINVLQNNNLFQVYDTNVYIKALKATGDPEQAAKESYRRFALDKVLAFLCRGNVYDMREENNIIERYGPEVYEQLTPAMIRSMQADENEADVIEEMLAEYKKIKPKILTKQQLKSFIKEEVERALQTNEKTQLVNALLQKLENTGFEITDKTINLNEPIPIELIIEPKEQIEGNKTIAILKCDEKEIKSPEYDPGDRLTAPYTEPGQWELVLVDVELIDEYNNAFEAYEELLPFFEKNKYAIQSEIDDEYWETKYPTGL